MTMMTAREMDRRVLTLAGPAILEMIASTLIGFVDTAMIGSMGANATAAIGAIGPFTWLLGGMIQSLGVGGTAIVARRIGEGNRRDAEHATGQVFMMTLILSSFIMISVLCFAHLVPVIMQAKEVLWKDSTRYLRIYALGWVPGHIGSAMNGVLRGAGDTKTPMRAGIIANALNVILNFLLIYPARQIALLGFSVPMWGAGMGVSGAAAASAAATAISGCYVMAVMRRGRTLKLCFAAPGMRFRFDRQVCGRILSIGIPAAMERAAVNIGQMVFTGMVSSIGVAEIAAHSLAIQVEGLGYMPAYGFAVAATALTGQYLGAGEKKNAEFAGRRCAKLGLTLLTAVGIGTFLFAPFLISLFTPDPEVRAIGAALIRICSFEQPFNALMSVYAGALRGAGDTRMPLIGSLISMWCVRVVPGYTAGILLGGGVYALWWCMVADLGFRSLWLFIRFRHGKWQLKKV